MEIKTKDTNSIFLSRNSTEEHNQNKQKKLAELRISHNLSYEDMAKFLSISTKSYIRKEQGKTSFKLQETFWISELFGRRFDEIFLQT
ncbi:hypothetical protein AQ616_09335 [Oceanobacillus sp. E9]|uniref:helix-turn-helix transcriptional regulator n=1 Tax=Oceanobacillus sp. E9 TaxID=1742575 RepID=UPI00084E5F8B|nr:hypothetical protein [Oceanobacillus sp. E9]OEH55235.1 hypothetical protein AQ616_09335 [Oceanobacillus sp. E9]